MILYSWFPKSHKHFPLPHSAGSLDLHNMGRGVLSKICHIAQFNSFFRPPTLTGKMWCNTGKHKGYIYSFIATVPAQKSCEHGEHALEFKGALRSQAFSIDFHSWFTFSLSPVVWAFVQHSLPARSIRFMWLVSLWSHCSSFTNSTWKEREKLAFKSK